MRTDHGTLTVNTDFTEIDPGFDIDIYSIYVVSGSVIIESLSENGWGRNATVIQDEVYTKTYCVDKIRVKSVSGNATLNFSLLGSFDVDNVSGIPNFSYDEDGDIVPVTVPIFVSDDEGDLIPSVDGTVDEFFEIDEDDDIIPKE